jgi:hypothetical protein
MLQSLTIPNLKTILIRSRATEVCHGITPMMSIGVEGILTAYITISNQGRPANEVYVHV